MDNSELILFAGLIFMASINAASLIWAFYLDHRLRQKPVPKHYEVHIDGEKVLKEVDLDQVEVEAVNEMHTIINGATEQLKTSLSSMTTAVTGSVEEKVKELADAQFAQYQEALTKSLQDNQQAMMNLEKEVADKRARLEAMLREAVEKEFNNKIATFETRLNDVVSSYLVESLSTNADMSAQVDAIVESLEKHKEEIKQDISA